MLRSTFLSFAICATLISSAIALPMVGNDTISNPYFCSTHLEAHKIPNRETDFQEKMASDKHNATKWHKLAANAITIPVYWSVVYADNTFQGGYISDQQIVRQIAEVNRGFQGTGLQFQLMDIDRFQNAYWFNNVDPATNQPQYDMKKRLRYSAAGPKALNIYSVGLNNIRNPGTLGYSSFPADYASRDPVYDGILIRYSTLPDSPGGFLGRILTHEVGHWVGLYHPFETFGQYQNGCSGPGDYVDDTPAEASPASGCPVGRDTCNGGGLDPIYNFMDYSNDQCRTQFTQGQVQRLRQQIYYYRGLS